MSPKQRWQTIFFVLMLTFFQPVIADPKVVVGNAPVHSLVSALMEGVAKPKLLTESAAVSRTELNPFQLAGLLTADMVVWAGAGYESAVDKALTGMPQLENKLLTLSNYVPLLPREGYDPLSSARQANRDLRFWSDPKLAVMAVRLITPRLVRLDPDNTERYLDNEIALLAKIKSLGEEVAQLLEPYTFTTDVDLNAVDPYFKNRFLANKLYRHGEGSFKKVSNSTTGKKACTVAIGSTQILPGSSHYFEMLRTTARSVTSCMRESHDNIKTTKAIGHSSQLGG
ncbi:MAG: zinc ABC transporter substrate-binding protein [Candidatus Thiodiazotropha lotti]